MVLKSRPKAKKITKTAEAPKKAVRKKSSASAPAKATKKVAKSSKPAPKKIVKKASAAPAKKATPKKALPNGGGRQLDQNGFTPGSDSAIIAATLLEGGLSREDVNQKVAANIDKVNGLQNRNGEQKYVPSMVSGILNRMLKTGDFEIEESWQLVRKQKPVQKGIKRVKRTTAKK